MSGTYVFQIWVRLDSFKFQPSGEGPFDSIEDAVEFCEHEIGSGWLIKPVLAEPAVTVVSPPADLESGEESHDR